MGVSLSASSGLVQVPVYELVQLANKVLFSPVGHNNPAKCCCGTRFHSESLFFCFQKQTRRSALSDKGSEPAPQTPQRGKGV